MRSEQEVQRLTQVYQTYQTSATVQAQWTEHNRGNRAIIQERSRYLQGLLQTQGYWPLTQRRLLDIGCGAGRILGNFLAWGAQPHNLYGVDLLPDRIAAAQQAFPDLHFQQANAERIEFPASTFDLVLLFTVFTSILDLQMAHNVAAEVQRVLKPGGAVIWYDFRYNNPYNPHVRGMTRAKIQQLFPEFTLHLRTVTLLPPLARRLGALTPLFYPLLTRLPLLRTHYLGLLVKP